MDILAAQLKARQRKKAFALATVVKTEGATPRGLGSKMIVYADGSSEGSIGGGVLEKQVLNDAAECVKNKTKILKLYENRAEETDSPCGGTITVFIESEPGAPELVVCGAGHVGGCLIRLASGMGYDVTAIDTRDRNTIAENIVNADSFLSVKDFYSGVKALENGAGAFFVIATYSHETDCEALAAALEKDSAYIGMLGSSGKIASVFQKLRDRGYSDTRLEFVHTPVGLNIGGETPAEIALAIMAEIQMIRYGGTGRSLKKA